MPEVNVQNVAHVPPLTESFAWRGVLVFAGASQAASSPFFAPITNEENVTVFPLAAGNQVLTVPLMRYGLLYGINPANSSIQIRSDALNGYTRLAGNEPSFFVQRRGAGALSINGTDGATINNPYNIATETLGPFHSPVRVFSTVDGAWYLD